MFTFLDLYKVSMGHEAVKDALVSPPSKFVIEWSTEVAIPVLNG